MSPPRNPPPRIRGHQKKAASPTAATATAPAVTKRRGLMDRGNFCRFCVGDGRQTEKDRAPDEQLQVYRAKTVSVILIEEKRLWNRKSFVLARSIPVDGAREALPGGRIVSSHGDGAAKQRDAVAPVP